MSKWEKVALKHIGEIVTGNTPSTKIDDYYNSNDIPFYKPNDISNTEVSKLNIATSYISETARSCARIIPCNSILVTCIGIIGKTAITTTECSCNQQINAIIPYKDLANSLYLAYAIMSKKTYMQDTANAPIVPIINKTKFASIEIPLPPLKEQHKIASILDTVSETLKLRKQQLNELDLLVKSKFEEMFGDPVENSKKWDVVPLDTLINKISDGVHAKPKYTVKGIPFISVTNVKNGYINFTNCKYVSKEDYSKMTKSIRPEKGDILYTKVGTYGISAYVDTDREFCLYVSVSLIKPKKELINPRFLAISMSLPYIKRQADKRIKGIGVPDLHLNQIKKFNICCPPMELQNKFVLFNKHIDELKSEVQKSIDQLQTLFDSLMQQYFE